MLESIGSFYSTWILEPGKQPMLFTLLAFVCTFVLTRMITRMIRDGKGNKIFKNVSAGGLHIHHVVPGMILLVIGGLMALGSGDSWVRSAAGLVFGIGAALVLDEFAMVLHLSDVYWTDEGRLSGHILLITTAAMGIVLVFVAPRETVVEDPMSFWVRVGFILLLVVTWILPVIICVLKGKVLTAVLGIFVIFAAWYGAARLAYPKSLWAHWFYKNRPNSLEQSRKRQQSREKRWGPILRRLESTMFGFTRTPESEEAQMDSDPLAADAKRAAERLRQELNEMELDPEQMPDADLYRAPDPFHEPEITRYLRERPPHHDRAE